MKKQIMKKTKDEFSKKKDKNPVFLKEDNTLLIDSLEELNLNVKDIEISELIPSVIDNVIVYIDDTTLVKEVVQDLPINMGGISFRNWRNNKGGIFARDVRLFIENKPHGKYAMILNKDEKTIIRLIEDEELRTFSTLKLLDGKIKDKAYMIFKKLNNGEKIISSKRYIEEKMPMISEEKITTHIEVHDEDSERYSGNSISLFND